MRILPAISVGSAAALSVWGALQVGCGWEYQVASVDGGEDVTIDETELDAPDEEVVADTGPFTLPDGRVCTGHDEDGDGVPDECDNCPNVANPTQAGSAVGAACAPSTAFIPSPQRLLFDPFKSISAWRSYGTGGGVFQVAADDDSLSGGSLTDELKFIEGTTGSGSSAVVATTTFSIAEEGTPRDGGVDDTGASRDGGVDGGSAGLLLRINPSDTSPRGFYLCAVSLVSNSFQVARATGCNGGPCSPGGFTLPAMGDAGPQPASLQIPNDIPHSKGSIIGLRASVSASVGDGGLEGDVECRIFDPKRPATLTSTEARYSIKVRIPAARWFSMGEVGAYAQRTKSIFHSIDVLRGP